MCTSQRWIQNLAVAALKLFINAHSSTCTFECPVTIALHTDIVEFACMIVVFQSIDIYWYVVTAILFLGWRHEYNCWRCLA